MENPKKPSVRSTYHTLRECLTDEEYLRAQRKMEEIQSRYRKMLKNDDIDPVDWDIIDTTI